MPGGGSIGPGPGANLLAREAAPTIHVEYVSGADTVVASGQALSIARPANLADNDIMVVALTCGNVGGEIPSWTLPSGWHFVGTDQHSGLKLSITRAFRYIDDITTEPTSYTFTYVVAARTLVGAILGYHGVIRDKAYNPAVYPEGYFAPNGSGGSSTEGTGTSATSVPAGQTNRRYTRALYMFASSDLASVPEFDDPVPLTAIRMRAFVGKTSMMLLDREVIDPTTPLPSEVARLGFSGAWLAITMTLESVIDIPDNFDNYKSKLLRSLFPPPYDTSLAQPLGKLLAVIGTMDNAIGGLFDDHDFLPNDPAGNLP